MTQTEIKDAAIDVCRVVIWHAAVVYLLVISLGTTLNFFEVGFDSTDGEKRSGLGLHIDNMTGCHYLTNPRGGIIKRVNANGEHICGVEK